MKKFRVWNRAYKPRDFEGRNIHEAITAAVEAGHIRKMTNTRKVRELDADGKEIVHER